MVKVIDLGMLIEYMPHWHISERQAQWRAKAIALAEIRGSLGLWGNFWNTRYSAKIGTCEECGKIYAKYKDQKIIIENELLQ